MISIKRIRVLVLALILLVLYYQWKKPGPFRSKVITRAKKCECLYNSVVFLKTHKSGTESMVQLLYRQALKNGWNFVTPDNQTHFDRVIPFSAKFLPPSSSHKSGLKYDLFCQHAVWNYEEIRDLMKPNPFYFSILRDPTQLYLSQWDYFHLENSYKMSLDEFMIRGTHLDRTVRKRHGRNRMLADFGLNTNDFEKEDRVNAKIEEIDKTFRLIMIYEFYDESLILLKNELCWDFMDIVLIKTWNARKKRTAPKNETLELLKQWQRDDYQLYNYFLKKFKTKLNQFGKQQMKEELMIFHDLQINITKTCNSLQAQNKITSLEDMGISLEKQVEGHDIYKMPEIYCSIMFKDMGSISNYLKRLQILRLRHDNSNKVISSF